MQNGSYLNHVKILGKAIYMYDNAIPNSDMEDLLVIFSDQVADTGVYDSVVLFSEYIGGLDTAFNASAVAIKAQVLSFVNRYLTSSSFTNTIEFGSPSSSSAKVSIEAWIVDMLAIHDNKTFTTPVDGVSGFVNFFRTVFAPDETTNVFHTASPGSFPDATYVIETEV